MFFDRFIARRRRQAAVRANVRSRRPAVELMEQRQLLATYITVGNVTMTEGTGGTSTANFVVSLSAPSTQSVSVDYDTADWTAHAGSDYVAASGTLTFAPGEKTKVVPVSIVPDATPELSELFNLNLSNSTNGTIFTKSATGKIVDDDTVLAPKLAVADVRMLRGMTGPRTMTFNITLNSAQRTSVSVKAATSNWSAVAGVDYTAKAELLTFAPGETTKSFTVTIFGTSTATSDKKFLVTLSGTSASLARGTAAGTMAYGA
ncbi:Calx-beta domain-containing protein [Planctomyces sp. SH-PL62]|uniref:Calx-beta domain-containing protein n=1 Tax=Planctomyces sp. SH-PL62 TaxID=1636152 RepID=UPI00078BD2B5|nr:Calx-beta domain-containing protein [Planctomyces sp. SH-PL62]AMV40420.1 Calx-beta domain protein [Planctomyces sp. SH-PL62]